MSVTPLPAAPSRNDDPDTFVLKADAFVAALAVMVQEINDEFALIVSALNYNGTSTTSVAIATGSKAFTMETGKLLQIGQFVTVSSTVSPANFMFGQVTAYNSGTGALTVNVTATGGAGTFAAWTIALSPTGIAPANVFNAVQTISVNGSPLIVDSANSTSLKVILKDAGVTKGGVGSGAAGANLMDSGGTARVEASLTGCTLTGVTTMSGAGTPHVVNSTDSTVNKLALQDATVVRGYLGANATGPVLSDSAGVVRAQVSTTGVLFRGKFGYSAGVGNGATVSQGTDKSTAVTINASSGRITVNAASLANGGKVFFVMNNSQLGAADTISWTISETSAGSYRIWPTQIGAGSCRWVIENISGGALAESPTINFNIIQGQTT